MTNARCEEIYSQVNQLQVSCNSAGFTGETGMMTSMGGTTYCNVCGTTNTNRWNSDLWVLTGQTFILYVSNWGSGAQAGFTLDFSESTAVIFDDVAPYLHSVEADQVSGCSETEITISYSENVTCQWVTPDLFTIEGPGGPYQVTDVYGPACELGALMEKDFTLTVDHPFQSNGSYTLYMSASFPGIQDACANLAFADTLEFELNLGAPIVDESGISIGDATCGMDNGYITGLSAGGQPPLTFTWKNSVGTIIGSTLDLIDIPAENYTLEVNDDQDCITTAGPFVVEEIGAPDIDDSGLTITPANFGSGNGAITGIQISSQWPISSYTWYDEDLNVVGNALDLTAVPTGYYELLVIDENTCEANAGPYFVNEIGGPLTANPSANPDVICRGESSLLSPGAGGGIGEYEYAWSSNPPGFNSTLQNPVVTPSVDTRYYILIIDHDLNVMDSVDIQVNELPEPNAGADHTIAHGISTFLQGSASLGSGNYHYYWTPVDKLEEATVQNPQTKNLYETTTFFLEVEDAVTGCLSESPDETMVQIREGMLSVNPIVLPDPIVCMGEVFELHANAGGGSGNYTYEWTDSVGTQLATSESFSLSLDIEGTYFFYLAVNDGYNDVLAYVEVQVDPAPFLDLGPPIQYHCPHETITLDAGNPGSSYLWSNGDTNRYTTVGTTGLVYDELTISVTVSNAEGCAADTTLMMIFDWDYCYGLDEFDFKLNAKVFPNPSTGKVWVEAMQLSGTAEIRIINILGELKHSISFEVPSDGHLKEEIDLSSLPRGAYIIHIRTDEGSLATELILH